VNLYNTPQLRGGLKRLLIPPFNEVVGLQHAKLYVFDDVTVVSG
jgi:CDP-diacylglycerol--glycerol-3-phosphate 3-phosphatidyltransferase